MPGKRAKLGLRFDVEYDPRAADAEDLQFFLGRLLTKCVEESDDLEDVGHPKIGDPVVVPPLDKALVRVRVMRDGLPHISKPDGLTAAVIDHGRHGLAEIETILAENSDILVVKHRTGRAGVVRSPAGVGVEVIHEEDGA